MDKLKTWAKQLNRRYGSNLLELAMLAFLMIAPRRLCPHVHWVAGDDQHANGLLGGDPPGQASPVQTLSSSVYGIREGHNYSLRP